MEKETKAEYIARFIKRWEGGWANDPDDSGGCTLSGVTIGTYRMYFGEDKTCKDLKNMTEKEWVYCFKKGFYWPCKADSIQNWSLALLIVDHAWMSGVKSSIKRIQRVIGTEADGIIGPKTLKILNEFPEDSFYKIWEMRTRYYDNIIAKNPVKKKYKKGWLNRLNSIEYNKDIND